MELCAALLEQDDASSSGAAGRGSRDRLAPRAFGRLSGVRGACGRLLSRCCNVSAMFALLMLLRWQVIVVRVSNEDVGGVAPPVENPCGPVDDLLSCQKNRESWKELEPVHVRSSKKKWVETPFMPD